MQYVRPKRSRHGLDAVGMARMQQARPNCRRQGLDGIGKAQHATDLEYAVHEASVTQVVQAPQALSKASACLRCLYRGSELLLLMLRFLCWLLLTACMHSNMHC